LGDKRQNTLAFIALINASLRRHLRGICLAADFTDKIIPSLFRVWLESGLRVTVGLSVSGF
jgi:hypothetical protein